MKTPPLISVVMGTYNGEKFLEQQIESILSQTYSNIELIISDDASTDATSSILKKYEQQLNVKVFYHSTNQGYIKNFEFALCQATGELIALSDQDDIWLNHKLEKLYQKFITQPHTLLVNSNSLLINEQNESLQIKTEDLKNLDAANDPRSFVFFNVIWGHSILISKKLLQIALPFPPHVPHDLWLGFKAAGLEGIQYESEVLTLYRQHAQTITHNLLPKKSGSRPHARRYNDFQKQLYWIEMMKNHAAEKNQQFFNTLYTLYKQKEKGKYNWKLLWFLLKHQSALFQFSQKNIFSRVVEIRKMARGEKLI